jgi:hypothetical protein
LLVNEACPNNADVTETLLSDVENAKRRQGNVGVQ